MVPRPLTVLAPRSTALTRRLSRSTFRTWRCGTTTTSSSSGRGPATATWRPRRGGPRQRRARAAFYAGLIDELLRGDPAAARLAYAEALRLGEQAGDELIMSYACRHLGFHMVADGDEDQGRELLRRSLELRQRLGCVPLVLAQQLALAEV